MNGSPVAGPSRGPHASLEPASQPEIIRAAQKDDFYISQLQDQVENVFRGVIGARRWHGWSSEIKLGTKLLYFSLTTLAGLQTLGEEYVDILQTHAGKRRMSPRRRGTLLALHIVTPYVVASLYNRLRRYAQARQDALSLEGQLEGQRAYSSRWDNIRDIVTHFRLPAFDWLMQEHIQPIHLALFFLIGRYYSLAKRTLSVRYVSTRPPIDAPPPPSYEVLGAIMAVQLLAKASIRLFKYWKERRAQHSAVTTESDPAAEKSVEKEKEKPVVTVDGQKLDELQFNPEDQEDEEDADEDEEEENQETPPARCMLCLSKKKAPTLTECGHVFCWTCIVGWAREKKDCPLCRQPVSLSRLLPLLNV